MGLPKNSLINVMSNTVKSDSGVAWFNRVAKLVDRGDVSNIFNERVAHLILYSNNHVLINDVKVMLSKSFVNSLFVIKCEVSKEKALVSTDTKDINIVKNKHFHCYITYRSPKGINPHLSFKSTVREMLKNKGRKLNLQPAEYSIGSKLKYKFTGYNIVNATKDYNGWDVFFNSREERLADTNKLNRCLSVPVDVNSCINVLNWISYITKKRTSLGRKNCIVVDNRDRI